MQIQIVAVGKIKGASRYLQTGIDEYIKRLKPYADVVIKEVAEETAAPTRTEQQVLAAEGQRLLAHLAKGGYGIALSEWGESLTSEAFSREFFKRAMGNQPNGGTPPGGANPMIFIIGGANGLAPELLKQCPWQVSLSPMTFPHQMVRLVLLEQLYRAFKIFRNEPYHK